MRVGPRNFNPARAVAETAGLNKPTKTILVSRVQEDTLSLKSGDTKRYSIADVEMVIAAPLRGPYAPTLDFETELLKQKKC